MNYELMGSIIKHIMANLAIISSTFVNLDKSKSLMTKEYLLTNKLSFQNENFETVNNNIWGCQISTGEQELKFLLGDCGSQDQNLLEYCLIVQLKNSPAYGLYIVYDNYINEISNDECLIAVTLNNKDWLSCSTYLQATFLAGMEQVREAGLNWSKCVYYKTQYELMLSFIKHYHNCLSYRTKDEG